MDELERRLAERLHEAYRDVRPSTDLVAALARRRRRRRDAWLAVGLAAAVCAAIVVPLSLLGRPAGERPAVIPTVTPQPTTVRPTPAASGPTGPAVTRTPAPSPTGTGTTPGHRHIAGLPGLVQVAAAAFPTDRHWVMLLSQCYPCAARSGTYTDWVAVTGDGGVSWTLRKSGVPLQPVDFPMAFADADNGWAAGGYVTHDGGLTWHRASLPVQIDWLAIADGTVWAITDPCFGTSCPAAASNLIQGVSAGPADGDTLQGVAHQPLAGLEPLAIVATGKLSADIQATGPDGNTVWLATGDGGHSWRHLVRPCPAGTVAVGRLAASPGSLWQACQQGRRVPGSTHLKLLPRGRMVIARSTDGGRHWAARPDPARIVELQPASAQLAWGADGVGAVSRTTDGAVSWKSVWSPGIAHTIGTAEALSSQSATTAEVTVAVSSGKRTHLVVYSTHDGGRSWTTYAVPLASR